MLVDTSGDVRYQMRAVVEAHEILSWGRIFDAVAPVVQLSLLCCCHYWAAYRSGLRGFFKKRLVQDAMLVSYMLSDNQTTICSSLLDWYPLCAPVPVVWRLRLLLLRWSCSAAAAFLTPKPFLILEKLTADTLTSRTPSP